MKPNKAIGFSGNAAMFKNFIEGLQQFGDMTILEFVGYTKRTNKHAKKAGRYVY